MLPEYNERFYKEAINGKQGNLFKRVEALEKLLKHLQVKDPTNYITQIVQENKEIIIPSLLGGVSDPTDPTFSGIVISPSGQMIGGVLYSFALVVDGVVVTGLGSDTTTIITGGGDVVGPASATDNHLAVFDGATGKLIKDGGAIPSGGTPSGADTNVQYNDGGAFGGDDNFKWDKTNRILRLKGTGGEAYILGSADDTSTGLYIAGGGTTEIDNGGGGVQITGGAGNGAGGGGGVGIFGAQGGTTGNGGGILLHSGEGGFTSGDAGGISLECGLPTNGNGSSIYLAPSAGAGGGTDGQVEVSSDINLAAGRVYKINGVPISVGGGAWGGITGTLSDQTDLQAALDAKASFAQVMARISIGF